MSNVNAVRNGFLDFLVGRSNSLSFGSGNTRRLVPYTTMPDLDGAGGVAVTGVELVVAASRFSTAASSGSVANTEDLEFPLATTNWGTVVGVGLFRGTYLLQVLSFAEPVSIQANDTLVIPAGNFRLTMT